MDQGERIEQLENALQRLVNLASFAVPLGTKGWLEAVPEAKLVLAGGSVTKPLREENKRLHEECGSLRGLLKKEPVIKAVVECIIAYEIDADYKSDDFGGGSYERQSAHELQEILEQSGIVLETDEESEEITHVQFAGEKLSFHSAEWEWTDENGKWPWEGNEG